MLVNAKLKKEVGFIKNQGHSQLTKNYQNQQADKSSDFSSFNCDDSQKINQFSPYRHPTTIQQVRQQYTKLQSQYSPKFSIKNKPISEIQNNIQKKSIKIQSSDSVEVQQNITFKQISKDDSENSSDPQLNKKIKNLKKKARNQMRYKYEESYDDEYSDHKQADQQEYIQSKMTYYPSNKKSSLKNQNNNINQQQNYMKSSRKQDLIQQYRKEDFNNKGQLRKQILGHQGRKNAQKPQISEYYSQQKYQNQKRKMYQTKGGVCFELDTHQFREPVIKSVVSSKLLPKQKKKKVNQKEEVLKRRQNAKIYDRATRFKIFGAC